MNPSKLTFIFILFIVIHMNLVIPVSKVSNNGDVCIMDNGIHMAHHSDNQKVHDHRGFVQHAHYSHHSGHEKSIHELRMDCSIDMSSSGIYFPGGEHPFTYPVMWTSDAGILNRETVTFPQAETSEGFIITPDNPPKPVPDHDQEFIS
ncbi:MAG: hypothetical protein HY578_09265 [Nitrospinae bacterium]|nr:hypothetical protein [Nitrospinota bacterium]